MSLKRCVLGLLGPTASGKTELAVELAERFNVALISVDSAMVYRGMNIGTAKPKPTILEKYPHALVDIVEPETSFTVSEFIRSADAAVLESFAENKTPLLVGGTMMYFKAFREGIAPLPPRDPGFRKQLRKRAEVSGIPALHTELQSIDPKACDKIHPNNYPRIERALEIFSQTGVPMTQFLKENAGFPATTRLSCDYVEFGITYHRREELHERVKDRLEGMLQSGFVDEVKQLRQRPGLSASASSMRTVGYRQLWEHFDECSENTISETVKERILVANRGLIRRQMTWLRNWSTLPNYNELSSSSTLNTVHAQLETLGVQPIGNLVAR
ncbi:MAG: tRNA (adenosine(37)-N6)-dimethylallyltransferase MiaA [Gammaproteobacteria bacterium]|nr:tRNA (adenosine(37)-N6)-dimethylallyltransferase MiaA [Gammaproteobacteria bacterium]MYF01527.1 tRNA (adenosine(37)-N6)-dimethylallyltransferase MiaA [Gammaproteobacteria bacterium]MYI78250.1 tRNA (adenosine(37)-N6)-dimethylallyltransferase MiaA [Gammaproteobacteria bacterium]